MSDLASKDQPYAASTPYCHGMIFQAARFRRPRHEASALKTYYGRRGKAVRLDLNQRFTGQSPTGDSSIMQKRFQAEAASAFNAVVRSIADVQKLGL